MKRFSPAVLLAAVVALLALGIWASRSPEPDLSQENLIEEYTRSTSVKNDMYRGATAEDRIAQFASEGVDPLSWVLSASICDEQGVSPCRPNAAVNAAVRRTIDDPTSAGPMVFERTILVKHKDRSLELVTLYVARKTDESAVVVDTTGETYSGDLDDFRENNDLLSSDDIVLAPADLTSITGKSEVRTVTGHTVTNWRPWILGGAVVLVGLLAASHLRARRRPQPNSANDS